MLKKAALRSESRRFRRGKYNPALDPQQSSAIAWLTCRLAFRSPTFRVVAFTPAFALGKIDPLGAQEPPDILNIDIAKR
jgi:hypothetical protein